MYRDELCRAVVDGARSAGSIARFLDDFRACARAFELFTAVHLTETLGRPFYLYRDLAPATKARCGMSESDTGVDVCDGATTIVQCKLRAGTVRLRDCATFFASLTCYSENGYAVAWPTAMLVRNACSRLSPHLAARARREPFDTPVPLEAFRALCTRLATPHLPIAVTHKCVRMFGAWRARGEAFRAERYLKINGKTLVALRAAGVAVRHRRSELSEAPYGVTALAYDIQRGYVRV